MFEAHKQKQRRKVEYIFFKDAEVWYDIEIVARYANIRRKTARNIIYQMLLDGDLIIESDLYDVEYFRAAHGVSGISNGLGGYKCVCANYLPCVDR